MRKERLLLYQFTVRYGGLGIKKPEDDCDHEYQASKEITRELKDAIILQWTSRTFQHLKRERKR